jgi:hypothetical protein
MPLSPWERTVWLDIRRRLEPEMKRRWWRRINWTAVAVVAAGSLISWTIWAVG